MDFLEKLTPAENYLLLENSKATMKGLLKLTMLDLLLKRVIKTEDVAVRADERSPKRILTYVQAGINFQSFCNWILASRPDSFRLTTTNIFLVLNKLEISE